MADIKLEDLNDGDENLDPVAMKGIYGGAGTGATDGTASTAPVTDPNQLPILSSGPNDTLPGQGQVGNSGGGGGGGCQL